MFDTSPMTMNLGRPDQSTLNSVVLTASQGLETQVGTPHHLQLPLGLTEKRQQQPGPGATLAEQHLSRAALLYV